ncbi:MAG: glycosyltransferase [Bacteroidia bacterium]|nr:glycosyltransferase [Bacteroidia bacterium]
MQPLVSIITVCYNAEKHLEQCMQSVLTQDYPNLEYILVDGKSTDGTLAIIQKIATQHPNVNYISETDKGIYDAMNKGIALAKGDIIACVNADDFLLDATIVKGAVALMQASNADVVHGNIVQQIELGGKQYRKNQTSNFANIMRNMELVQGTSYWRKEAIEKIGTFDISYKIVADYDYVLRGVKLGLNYVMSNDVWLVFRIGGISTTTCKSSKENMRLTKVHNTGTYWNYVKRYYTCIIKSFLKKRMKAQLQTPEYLYKKGWI